MSLPGQDLSILDPGLGLSEQSENAFVFLGTCQKGSTTEVKAFTKATQVEAEYGDGELTQALCHTLSIAGGPVYACRLAGTVAGASGSVTKTAVASSTGTITLSGAPYDRYQAILTIVATGTLGTATFKYSLDNGRTYSEVITVPSGGTYVLPNTNITVTFVPGAGAVFFEAGDIHTWDSTAPHYSSTELAAGVTAINSYLSTHTGFAFDAVIALGRNATGSGAATLFGALGTHMTAWETAFHYMRSIMDGGSGDSTSNALSGFASLSHTRVAIVYGDEILASSKPFQGYGAPLLPAVVSIAARAAAILISTDPGRVADGALVGVTGITYDEDLNQLMDSAGFSTLRKFPMEIGYFITNLRLKSPIGSDYVYWQYGRIMDVLCRVIILAQNKFVSSGFATKADGTIAEDEAKRLEAIVSLKIAAALMSPLDVEGRPGHISAYKYRVDRDHNFLATNALKSAAAARPKSYAKNIITTVGYAADVGEES
jgi:hypothetical protein